ncbi:hypothetical protein AK812_SmicGene28596 [Symbiodinium microadriaticum]|uniref:Uncharacterized protein n=1 Tax=Symbiodinium microadriaticum TaxID=2951 RepID=A0A1Q9D407_SYMMI|nr:hypothetical protein AK812_SmicGene28596 [Symbiodinium microadriaticum]
MQGCRPSQQRPRKRTLEHKSCGPAVKLQLANTLWSLASMVVRDAEVLAGFDEKVLAKISEFKCLDVAAGLRRELWVFGGEQRLGVCDSP